MKLMIEDGTENGSSISVVVERGRGVRVTTTSSNKTAFVRLNNTDVAALKAALTEAAKSGKEMP